MLLILGSARLAAGRPSATGGRERAVAIASFDCYPRMRE
jgi:hypothetical protein